MTNYIYIYIYIYIYKSKAQVKLSLVHLFQLELIANQARGTYFVLLVYVIFSKLNVNVLIKKNKIIRKFNVNVPVPMDACFNLN